MTRPCVSCGTQFDPAGAVSSLQCGNCFRTGAETINQVKAQARNLLPDELAALSLINQTKLRLSSTPEAERARAYRYTEAARELLGESLEKRER